MGIRHGVGLTVGIVAAWLLGACGGTGVPGLVRVAPDTYRLSRVDGVGKYADGAALKAAVIADAEAFARSQGKLALPVTLREDTMRVGHLSSIDYEFRLATPGAPLSPAPAGLPVAAAPAAPAPVLAPAAVATAAPVAAPAAVPAAAPAAPAARGIRPDLYTDLLKLDELRKRGILTEDEFQMLKARLLSAP